MPSIGEILGKFDEFYQAGSYQDALALVTAELPNHPAYTAMLLCFSAAMSARLGNTTAALEAFKTALAEGYWYHEGALRNDPDFASLQTEAEFKTIIEQCTQRRQSALANAKPLLRVLEPSHPTESAPLLIAIHGNITQVDEYGVHWQSAVERGWRVALPQSSSLSWFSGGYDWGDVDQGLHELTQHYQTLLANYAVDPAQVVIAGFSMGGLLAARSAITKQFPVRGLLWIEGAPDEDFEQLCAAHQPFDWRAYFVYGQSQNFLQTATALSQTLQEVGVVCQIEALPHLYHEFPADFPQTLERALAFFAK